MGSLAISKTPPALRPLQVEVDERARQDPDRVCFATPKSSDLSDGYRDVTFSVFANAVNHLSWWMESAFGKADDFQTICYIGKSDMRYQIITVAAAKTRYKVLFSSHMNSLVGHLNLLEKTSCHLFISADGVEVSDILASRPMKHALIPELDMILSQANVRHYPSDESWEECKDNPYLILHTSGSTGLPKPVVYRQSCSACLYYTDFVPDPKTRGYDKSQHGWGEHLSGRCLNPFAPFHVIGAQLFFTMAIWANTVYVYGLQHRLMNTDDILKAIELANLHSACLSPALLEDMSKSETRLQKLDKLATVACSGGALSPDCAAKVLLHTKLQNGYGMTEAGTLYTLEQDPESWGYISFDDEWAGIDWRPVDSKDTTRTTDSEQSSVNHAYFNGGPGSNPAPGLYELVLVRHEDPDMHQWQLFFNIYPELTEWESGDLFSPHPAKRHTWKYEGRTDDLICFAHGLKFHPLEFEARLRSNHLIQNALLTGQQHNQAVLMLELTEAERKLLFESSDEKEKERIRQELVEAIWPLIEEINVENPSVAQISKTHILLAKSDKPFLRTPKATVQRRATVGAYREEIEEIYRKYGDKAFTIMSRTSS